MTITPLILGSGRSGQAMAKSLSILNLLRPELNIASPVLLTRGSNLLEERKKHSKPILCITNPHGLHYEAILEADKAGYAGIICEKPACVNLDQVSGLRNVKTPTAILHVYRQTWGLQTLKKMLSENYFGEIISIEGRYWQASSAERALLKSSDSKKSWKDDLKLSGEFDTYLDLGTHWIDAVSFLFGSPPAEINGWRSFINSQTAHRDSHIQLTMEFPNNARAFGSISKTFHGATNHFEINLIGSLKSATWKFLNPDEIMIGEGRDRKILTRKDCEFGSKQPPHHGLGWLEGYIEITSQLLSEVAEGKVTDYPKLSENLNLLDSMLNVRWQ